MKIRCFDTTPYLLYFLSSRAAQQHLAHLIDCRVQNLKCEGSFQDFIYLVAARGIFYKARRLSQGVPTVIARDGIHHLGVKSAASQISNYGGGLESTRIARQAFRVL